MAFTMNQNSAVCLPLLSESQKIIWVHSHQIDLQPIGAAELEKAFDTFPYLTHSQTTALAQRCSLHPDQVKVWFMAQRLRYGISWDYRDICRIRKEVMPSQGKARGNTELQNRTGREAKKRERKKRRTSEVEEKQRIAKDGGIMEGNKSAEEERNKQPMKKKMDKKESNTSKKRRTTAEIDKTRKRKQDNESMMESKRLCTQPELEKPAHPDVAVPQTPLDSSSLLIFQSQTQTCDTYSLTDLCSITNTHLLGEELQAEETNSTCFVTDTAKRKELTDGNSSPVAFTFAQQQDPPVVSTLSTPVCSNTKSQAQLLMMKSAFVHCQYPDSEQYDRLAVSIGVSRPSLVRSFAKMRYMVKKRRPWWMTEEQYTQAVINVKTLTTR